MKRETRMCSRKKRFRDLKEAKKSIGNINRDTGDELRYYECEYCGGYHLSSVKYGESGFGVKRKQIKKR